MIRLKNLFEAKPKYKIFCDMDGVLVDFDKGFTTLSKGVKPDSLPKPRFWAMFYGLTKGKEREYWAGLPWMSDGQELWNYIKSYKPEILTAPPSDKAKEGKNDWCKDNLGSVKINFKQARDKHHFVAPDAILIDDKASTIDKWNAEGGVGIHHTSASNTIKQLKKLGL